MMDWHLATANLKVVDTINAKLIITILPIYSSFLGRSCFYFWAVLKMEKAV